MKLDDQGRPSWDDIGISVASLWSLRSTCPRAATGAVIFNREHQILTAGYNGAPRSLSHCHMVGCHIIEESCVRAVHAEANAIVQAARVGYSVKGGIIYTTHRPCVRCTLLILQAGIAEIIWLKQYETDRSYHEVVTMCLSANVAIVKYKGGLTWDHSTTSFSMTLSGTDPSSPLDTETPKSY